ncbi:prepilin-type N-terminal cleavage/methylation domain-containing protein [Desulfonauticus submarinus]|uniref:Prepilin-type N-terminal cleavage/methylation domain-containing protein n=1 Tax=Desulfonauticus submarinus TaxID=206665 RepID=A0A1H0DJS3_9BACT|nr:type II secretion system protein [Desulfonauticus submarinus]SDN70308.1 prepilin-type N-terminal cleavage/methylation domain-containing protein [Desulfonauticus submarinus]
MEHLQIQDNNNTIMANGFTLLEILASLIIIGILIAVSVSRVILSPEDNITLDIIKNHVRYAELKSLNSDFLCGVRFQPGEYFLFCDLNNNKQIDSTDILLLPGQEHEKVGVKFLTTYHTIIFDNWGRPFADLDLNSPIGGKISLSKKYYFYLTPETGFIP